MNSLTVLYTYQCNYNCPFCVLGNKINYIKDNKLWSKETKEKCFNYILENNIKYLSIMGGEPLIYPNECINIINFCKENNIKVSIATNVSLLTVDLVDFFNKNNIYIMFSLNYYGYKSIDYLLRKSKSKNIINLIKLLKYKSIRTIYNKDFSLSLEASILHQMFNCGVEFSLDFTKLKEIDHNELDYLENEINKLRKYNSDISWFGLAPMGNQYDNGTVTIYPDGTIVEDKHRNNYDCIYYGHPRLYKDMSPEIYNRYMCISNSLLPRNNNFNSCIYS